MEPTIVYALLAIVVVLLVLVAIRSGGGSAPKEDTWESHVFEHEQEFTEIGESLWVIRGHTSYGMPRNMVVCGLRHGAVEVEETKPDTPRRSLRVKKRVAQQVVKKLGVQPLLIHSCVALNEETMAKLEKLGKPTVLVVPNAYHRMDAALYKKRYPDAVVLCPEASKAAVSKVVEVNGTCEEHLSAYEIKHHAMPGNSFELMYQLPLSMAHPAMGYAFVVTDAMFNMPTGNIIGRILGSIGPLGVTRIGRMFMGSGKKAFADWLREIKDEVFWQAVIVAHGDVIRGAECAEQLEAAADRLWPAAE